LNHLKLHEQELQGSSSFMIYPRDDLATHDF